MDYQTGGGGGGRVGEGVVKSKPLTTVSPGIPGKQET